MITFALIKQCIPLLDESGHLQEWFLWLLAPIVLFVVLPAIYRFITGAESRAEANKRSAGGIFVVCLLLLVVGWGMSQFFTPNC